ncbi:hypothetical protein PYW07_014157 [Mythimna separata]|uniref:Insulin-like domain-containing protein n=1 Tax=Mythimna separata TaxID=271217 RepID=A0AAD7YYA5_MYTSE|nr:hypothetical protein PYW07_014157 [Mythimna separata]
MKLTLVLLLVVVCSWKSEAQDGARFYCGRYLSEVLASLCWGSQEEVKRDAGWWLPQRSVRAMNTVRGKRGLADECCLKPCTIDEMMTYC